MVQNPDDDSLNISDDEDDIEANNNQSNSGSISHSKAEKVFEKALNYISK